MANSKKVKPVNLDRDIVELFDKTYPKIRNIFLERCLYLSLQDKEYFEKVFFNEIFLKTK